MIKLTHYESGISNGTKEFYGSVTLDQFKESVKNNEYIVIQHLCYSHDFGEDVTSKSVVIEGQIVSRAIFSDGTDIRFCPHVGEENEIKLGDTIIFEHQDKEASLCFVNVIRNTVRLRNGLEKTNRKSDKLFFAKMHLPYYLSILKELLDEEHHESIDKVDKLIKEKL